MTDFECYLASLTYEDEVRYNDECADQSWNDSFQGCGSWAEFEQTWN